MPSSRPPRDPTCTEDPADALSQAAGADVPVRLPRRATASSIALFVLLGAATASLGAALPAIRVLYPAAAGSGGRLVSLYMLGSLIAIVAGGFGETKLPPASAITSLVGFFAAGCLGIGLAPNWTLLQVAAVAGGAGFGGLALYVNTAFVQASDGRNLVMLNLLNAAYGAGAVAGPIATGALGHLGVRLLFPACGLLAIACLPARDCSRALARRAPSPPRQSPALPGPPRPAPARNRPSLAALKVLLPFVVIGFLYDGLETGTGAWQSTHLVWIGYSVTAAAQIASLFWAGMLLGRLVIPALTTRLSPPAIAFGGTAAAAVALCGASLPWLAPYGYALAGLGLAPVFPAMLAMVSRTAASPQFANGVMLSACMVGGVIWPAIIGLVAVHRLPATIPFALAGISGLCLVAIWNSVRRARDGQEISHS
ncbi:MAG TPA: MFS transporter [Streptosporangiaceae bacterium]|nr:MFS transporter [Streptosporangiaceae bacterium]